MADGSIHIAESPLAPGASPVRIQYREWGTGQPVVLLHGGWGYEIYPFDRQIAAFEATRRIVAPDRTGYGGSNGLRDLPTDFHQRAAEETIRVLDALGLERPILWGHSDGAVIALRLGLTAPWRVTGIIAEATHFFRNKPASRGFFETMRDAPDRLGERVAAVLAHDHGAEWRRLIHLNGAAWLGIGTEGGDLYDGRLGDLQVPTLVIHGERDPRTEPGELDAIRHALAAHRVALLPTGGHSPHSERGTADEVTRIALEWIADREDDDR
ncbi:MAG TPA: alpha/beta hydrolase [Vicinamibacterales bacterium]